MNYRHAYHAGNHADILKHVVLSRILSRMAAKPNPFTVLDTHAGIGHYSLMSQEAGKTLEWQTGIGKMTARFPDVVEELLVPFRSCIRSDLDYPGSPAIIAQFARSEDRLIFNELHPEDHVILQHLFETDKRALVTREDAAVSIRAKLPFLNRRGLVLIDPPFESDDETMRTVRMLKDGLKRMSTAVVLIWYPVTTVAFADAFIAAMMDANPPNLLKAEIIVKTPGPDQGLAGSGLLIVNAPWKLDDDLQVLVPALADRLGVDNNQRHAVHWLKPRS